MKIVLREWYKDKFALALLAINIMFSITYTIVNTYITLLVPGCLDGTSQRNAIIQIGCMIILQVIMSYISRMTRQLAVSHCFSSMNDRFGDKLLDADYAMFTKNSNSAIMMAERFMREVTSLMMNGIGIILMVISLMSIMWGIYMLSPGLLIPIISIYAGGFIMIRFVYNKVEKISVNIHKKKKIRNQTLDNIVDGFVEVRSYGLQRRLGIELHEGNLDVYNLNKKKAKITASLIGLIELVDGIGMLSAIIYSIYMISNGSITIGTASALIMYVFRVINPLVSILDFMSEFSDSIAGAKDFEEIMNFPKKMQEGNIRKDQFNDKISLENISFHYDDSDDVIKGISIDIKKGERIGICGSSGNGKSTLFKLLHRFYDPTDGAIKIDGINLKDINSTDYMNIVGSVQQENIIFPASIYDNVAFGKQDATNDEIIEACKRAHIYDFIIGLKDGFQTQVGPKGLKLSGGQKQRISLARLFLKDPQIILLDEATSALDNDTETFIQDAISSLDGSKTVITIAHRLSTIRDCDRIIVIDQGRIVEYGTHDDLMDLHGIYYQMQR